MAVKKKKKKKAVKSGSRMGRRVAAGLLTAFATAAVVLGGAYLVYANQYKKAFIEGTYINGIDVSDMTAEQAEDAVKNKAEQYALKLVFRGGSEETIPARSLGYSYKSSGQVAQLMTDQNPCTWILGALGYVNEHQVDTAAESSSKTIKKTLKALKEVKKGKAPTDAKMHIGKDHLVSIKPEKQGSQLDMDTAVSAIAQAVAEGKTELDLDKTADAYVKPQVTSDDKKLKKQVREVNNFLSTEFTYTFYDDSEVTVDASVLYKWLSKDESGAYTIDEDKVREKAAEFIKDMAEEKDDASNTWIFHSTLRGDIEYSYGSKTYGHRIDQDAESAALAKAVLECDSKERNPIYSLDEEKPEEITDYVEVDITNQRVYCYIGGELKVATDCVTGKASDDSRITHKGIFDIYYKQRNRVLKGKKDPKTGKPSYESPVKYWMAFNGAEGLHDASWRSNFGGSIYKNSGSHGCVNLPTSAARDLYDYTYKGMTVIVF